MRCFLRVPIARHAPRTRHDCARAALEKLHSGRRPPGGLGPAAPSPCASVTCDQLRLARRAAPRPARTAARRCMAVACSSTRLKVALVRDATPSVLDATLGVDEIHAHSGAASVGGGGRHNPGGGAGQGVRRPAASARTGAGVHTAGDADASGTSNAVHLTLKSRAQRSQCGELLLSKRAAIPPAPAAGLSAAAPAAGRPPRPCPPAPPPSAATRPLRAPPAPPAAPPPPPPRRARLPSPRRPQLSALRPAARRPRTRRAAAYPRAALRRRSGR
jgi:hypothetical protein